MSAATEAFLDIANSSRGIDFTPLADEPATDKFHGTACVAGKAIDWTAEYPHDTTEITSDSITFLVPGIASIKRHSRGERHATAVEGELTVSYAPARSGSNLMEDFLDPQRVHTSTLQAVIAGVQCYLQSERPRQLRDTDPSHLTLSAHSMGGRAATETALAVPEQIQSVMYKASIGFGAPNFWDPGSLDFPKLLSEIHRYFREEPNIGPQHLFESVAYFGRNPLRAMAEVVTSLATSLEPGVRRLRDNGIHTGYLGFELDPLVHCATATRRAATCVDAVRILPGVGHLAPQSHPAETVAAVRELRTA
jgi:hypothetical protein